MTYQEFLQTLNKAYRNSPELVSLVKQIAKAADKGKATYEMAQKYAVALGKILGKTINETGVLSDEQFEYSVEYVARILRPALKKTYDLSSDAATMVQDSINKSHGINLKPIKPKVDNDRIDNMIKEIANRGYTEDEEKYRHQFENLNQSAVDRTMYDNGDFLEHTGVTVTYTRIAESGACKWCRSMAGTYSTHEAPDGFFARHTNCNCYIKVNSMVATGTVNAWTKAYDRAVREGRVKDALSEEES